jgi:hypothetical protein
MRQTAMSGSVARAKSIGCQPLPLLHIVPRVSLFELPWDIARSFGIPTPSGELGDEALIRFSFINEYQV